MRKGIEAIESQIDSVTAYYEKHPRQPRSRIRSIQAERYEREADLEELKELAARQREAKMAAPRRATIVERWAEECPSCGGPRMVHIDQDNQRVVESHSSGSEGSDVPCYGGW